LRDRFFLPAFYFLLFTCLIFLPTNANQLNVVYDIDSV